MLKTNRYFASLGIQPDSADSLVDFAFDRQSLCDPAHRSYYLECLQALAQSRGTETLQTKVAMMASEGMVSRRDLTAAYRQLNIPHNEAQTVSDERILNLFYVRISDLGPGAQQDARQALNQIGMSRNSKRLINASMQTLETYEDALEWLGNGVDKKTADEALLAVVAIKV
jgi:ubiquitin carboxyl-terminal hydrolase 25/28